MVLIVTLMKKGKQGIRKNKWVSCHTVIPIPVLGSSRDSQVHLTQSALKKQKSKKTQFFVTEKRIPGEWIDLLFLTNFPFKNISSLSQQTNNPNFITPTKCFQGPEYPTLGRIEREGEFGGGRDAITGFYTIFNFSAGVGDNVRTSWR